VRTEGFFIFLGIAVFVGSYEYSSIVPELTAAVNIQSTLGNVQSTLGNIQTALGNIQSTLGNVQSTLGNIQPFPQGLFQAGYNRWRLEDHWIKIIGKSNDSAKNPQAKLLMVVLPKVDVTFPKAD
jgi:hypothetical protein